MYYLLQWIISIKFNIIIKRKQILPNISSFIVTGIKQLKSLHYIPLDAVVLLNHQLFSHKTVYTLILYNIKLANLERQFCFLYV